MKLRLCTLRVCLEQMFFLGKMKETKTEERKTRRPFGTKKTSGPFPPEACSNNTVSHEKKHMLLPLISFSFALASFVPVLCIPAFQTLIRSYFMRFAFYLFYHYIFIPFLYFFLFLYFQFLCSKHALKP